jgi:hypothetical protein
MFAILIQRSNHLQQIFLFIFSQYFFLNTLHCNCFPVLSVIRTFTLFIFFKASAFLSRLRLRSYPLLPSLTCGLLTQGTRTSYIIKTAFINRKTWWLRANFAQTKGDY